VAALWALGPTLTMSCQGEFHSEQTVLGVLFTSTRNLQPAAIESIPQVN